MSLFYGAEDAKGRRPLLAFILLTLLVGACASVFSEPGLSVWYAGLAHPLLVPPNWMFAPLWTAFYVLMAAAAWRVWRITGTRSIEISAYATQLALNFLWNAIFFGLHRITLAFAESLVLDGALLLTAVLFFRRDRLAGLMLLPVLAFSLYTSLLSHDLGLLNP